MQLLKNNLPTKKFSKLSLSRDIAILGRDTRIEFNLLAISIDFDFLIGDTKKYVLSYI